MPAASWEVLKLLALAVWGSLTLRQRKLPHLFSGGKWGALEKVIFALNTIQVDRSSRPEIAWGSEREGGSSGDGQRGRDFARSLRRGIIDNLLVRYVGQVPE